VFRYSIFEFSELFRFPNDATENIHEFCRFLGEGISIFLMGCIIANIDQPKPIPGFLRFFPAYLDSHEKVFLAERLIRFNIIGSHRARSSHNLLGVFLIRDRSRQRFYKRSDRFGENQSSVFQIVPFLLLHLRRKSEIRMPKLERFLISDFVLRASCFSPLFRISIFEFRAFPSTRAGSAWPIQT
jgi:hypothetical protein